MEQQERQWRDMNKPGLTELHDSQGDGHALDSIEQGAGSRMRGGLFRQARMQSGDGGAGRLQGVLNLNLQEQLHANSQGQDVSRPAI